VCNLGNCLSLPACSAFASLLYYATAGVCSCLFDTLTRDTVSAVLEDEPAWFPDAGRLERLQMQREIDE
jgi:hypothetical protein